MIAECRSRSAARALSFLLSRHTQQQQQAQHVGDSGDRVILALFDREPCLDVLGSTLALEHLAAILMRAGGLALGLLTAILMRAGGLTAFMAFLTWALRMQVMAHPWSMWLLRSLPQRRPPQS